MVQPSSWKFGTRCRRGRLRMGVKNGGIEHQKTMIYEKIEKKLISCDIWDVAFCLVTSGERQFANDMRM